MKITAHSNIVGIQQPQARPAKAAAGTSLSRASTEPAAAADLANLEITREALRRAAPECDVGRVAQIKAGLKSGAIRFDAHGLAGMMLALHRNG